MDVIKRDGTVVPFDEQRIFNAVYKAYKATFPEKESSAINAYSNMIMTAVVEQCKSAGHTHTTVESIQDLVEENLMSVHAEVAKNYILYRQKRTESRDMKSDIFKTIGQFMTTDIEDMDEKRENANIDSGAPMGAMLKIGGTATKTFNLTKLINPKYAQMHRDGKIHIHDLDFMGLCVNCIYIPADKLLDRGFSTGHGSLRSPTTIGTAATQTAILIQSNQNDMFQ